ncbi:cell division protein PerM [Cellulomonas soli]
MSTTPPRTGGTPAVGQAPRRVLSDEPRRAAPFFASAIDGAPRWVAGVLCALQGALLSLLVLVVPAVVAYVATSADPSNEGVGWLRSVGVGAGLWLLGHGVPLSVGGASVSLVPLGVSALAVFTCYASARRSGVASRSGLLAGVGTYVLLTLVVALAAGVSGGALAVALLGAAAVAVLGLGTGLLARPEAPSWREVSRPVWSRVAAPARVGAAAGALAVAVLVLLAAVLASVWVLAGRASITDLVRALNLDVIGGSVLAVTELTYAPNLVVWAFCWIVGPGFAVGDGSRFAPAEVVAVPLPTVPLLGSLPTPDAAGGPMTWTPVLVLLVGALVGWTVHRRLQATRARDVLVALGALALTAGALSAVLVALAAGAIGPGSMAVVGGVPWLVGGAVAAGVLIGSTVLAVPADPMVRTFASRRRAARHGSAASADDAAASGPAARDEATSSG